MYNGLSMNASLTCTSQVDLSLPSWVKSVCSSVTVEIFWHHRHGRWNRGSRGSSCSPNFWHGRAPPKVWAFCTARLDWVEST